MDRETILERIFAHKEPWDIVVIGGGATGVGCAFDAASRGLDVLLLEQHDFGKGTSSRSTKLVHGGVRYLAKGNISLVREALQERGILIQNAPHVVHKQAFIVPCYSLWQKIFYGIGLKLYDLLSGSYSFGRSSILSRSQTMDHLGNISADGLKGGVLYYDGQFDDARLLIDIVKTAATLGSAVLNYAKVNEIKIDEDGRISGLKFIDQLTGNMISIKAKVVINAAGAFCDSVRALSDSDAKPLVTLSQGIHLVIDHSFLPGKTAIMIPKTSDGRVLFCIPWLGHIVIGTTDTAVSQAVFEPRALDEEIDFVLDTAGKYLLKKPSRADILSVFVGIRPLVKAKAAKTSSLSRDHLISVDAAGLVTITGGKWTTYRRMAEDAVNVAIKQASLPYRESRTKELTIQPPPSPSAGSKLLHSGLPYTFEQVQIAVRDEMAQTVEDVLARRTRALFLDARAAIDSAPAVARLIAKDIQARKYDPQKDVEDFLQIARGYIAV